MTIGSLVAELQVNGADRFTADMLKAAESTEQTTVIIHEQRAAWSQLAANAIPAIGQVSAAGLSLASTLAVISHQKALIASVTAPVNAAGAALWRYGGIALKVGSMVVPQLKAIAIGATVVKASWMALTSEFAKDVYSGTVKQLAPELTRIQSAAESLGSTYQTAVTDSLFTAQEGLKAWAAEWHIADTLANAATYQIRGYVQGVASGVEFLDSATKEAARTFTAFKFILETGKGADAAAEFLAQGDALRIMQAETSRVIALQEQQRGGFELIAQIQREAGAAAAHAGELQRIASLESIEAIDNETRSLQQRAAALNLAGDFDPTKLKQFAEMFATLERQRVEVASGRTQAMKESPITAILDQAYKAIDLARGGQDEFAIGTAIANGATAEQVQLLRNLHAELKTVTDAQEANRIAEQAAQASEQRQNQLREQGAERIASLRDQIDLLTGSASAADIAMRELTRQGFSQEQVSEIGKLTEELDALQKKPDASTRPVRATAALRGSQEAASIALRGVGGGKTMEVIAQKQLGALLGIQTAVKAAKPQPLMAANF